MDFMASYYQLLFPFEPYIKWLSYDNRPSKKKNPAQRNIGNYISRREFSMTLPGDIYIRYQTIPDGENLQQNAQYFSNMLKDKRPVKIDIGAISKVTKNDFFTQKIQKI